MLFLYIYAIQKVCDFQTATFPTPNVARNLRKMEGIGNTPLIKLKHLTSANCADIYVKVEGANPTGSMKDRMALAMIEGAERRGDLKKEEPLSIILVVVQEVL